MWFHLLGNDISTPIRLIHTKSNLCTISYPLFADADTGIYPHAASQYHAWPSAARGIAMLRVDKFPYPRKQQGITNLSHAQTIFMTFWNVSAALNPQLSHLSGLNYRINSVTRSYRSGKESGRRGRNRNCDVINDVPLSLYLTLMTSNVRYGSIFHGC